jgi:hypothetical protein
MALRWRSSHEADFVAFRDREGESDHEPMSAKFQKDAEGTQSMSSWSTTFLDGAEEHVVGV